MADLVLGIGSSHSPALNVSTKNYIYLAQRDKNLEHFQTDGTACSYEELLKSRDGQFQKDISKASISSRIQNCHQSIEKLVSEIAGADLDALVIVGDDQKEQYHDENMPAILVYTGNTIQNHTLQLPDNAPEFWKTARSQFHEKNRNRDYPVASSLALHLADHLIEHHFDISHSDRLGKDRGEGHAFGFVHRRLMQQNIIPIVPIILNTYYPPNQPRPARCIQLGLAIRNGIQCFSEDLRIGIVASGGLSHFTIDEPFDRELLDAMQNKDTKFLSSIPINKLKSGNSEIRNWLTVFGAVDGLTMHWKDYQPCYRTPAGTGCGMAFSIWK